LKLMMTWGNFSRKGDASRDFRFIEHRPSAIV
jgi:hypothetical protein